MCDLKKKKKQEKIVQIQFALTIGSENNEIISYLSFGCRLHKLRIFANDDFFFRWLKITIKIILLNF